MPLMWYRLLILIIAPHQIHIISTFIYFRLFLEYFFADGTGFGSCWALVSSNTVGGEREIWYYSQLHELLTALCTSLTNGVSDTCWLQQPHSPDGTRTCWVGGCWDVPAGMLCSSVVLGGCEKRLHLNCLRFGFHFSFRTMKRSSFAPVGEAAESRFKVICGNILVSAE